MDFRVLNSQPACCSLDINGAEQERLMAISKALGNPVRFAILKYLLTHPGCITGDLVETLPVAQATTSQHLKVLRECGLIHAETEGVKSCYTLNDATLKWYKEKISSIF